MGKLIVGTIIELEIDDRTLAHVREIILSKLAKQESLLMNWHPAKAIKNYQRFSVWINPGIPLQFIFYGSKEPELNPRWLEALEETCHSIRGLEILEEKQVEEFLANVQSRKEQLFERTAEG